jgi:hypothetical protein
MNLKGDYRVLYKQGDVLMQQYTCRKLNVILVFLLGNDILELPVLSTITFFTFTAKVDFFNASHKVMQ